MKPLHVALVVKNTPSTFARDDRNMGLFSYAVPEFTWEHLAPGKGFTLSTDDLKRKGFDLVLHEDGGAWGDYLGHALPIVYYSIDSTLSEEFHFRPRFEQARKADLVLVDHDDLSRFKGTGKPVHRLRYAVNDRLFYPREKTIDVCFHCGSSEDRGKLRTDLSVLCRAFGVSYVSGAVDLATYADHVGRSLVVVNLPRTARNRPHRVYDALACGATLLTAPLPTVSGEGLRSGDQYVPLTEDLEASLERALVHHERYAEAGIAWAADQTWAVRAKELRGMLQCALSV